MATPSPDDLKNLREEAESLGSILDNYVDKIKDNAKLIARITGDSAKAYDPQISKTKNLAKELQKVSEETLSNAKERGNVEKSLNSIQKELLANQTKREAIAKRLTTATRAEQRVLLDILDSYDDAILSSKELIENTKSLASTFIDIERNLGITGDILEGINKIPILNKFLDVKSALEASNKEAASLTGTRWSVMGAALKSLGQSLRKNLSDPLVIIGVTIKLFKELVNLGLAFSQRTADIARNLGISSSEAQILNQRFSDITASSNNLLSTQTNLLEATNQINDRFGTSAMLTESMLEDQIDLTKKLGLSGEEAAAFAEYSLLSGKSQEDIVNAIGKQNKGLLNNKKVIQAVAKVGGQLNAQYKGNPELIAKAVVQAQKLGMTLEDTQGIAKSLLNFEESIANELSAELITGMDLNLEKARYLALQGKSAEAAAELMKNLGPNGLNKFQNMNVIQQEALAGALGMSADQLADSLRTQQAISKLSVKDKQAYKDAIKAAQEKGDFDKAAALEKQMNQGKEFELAKVNLDAQQKFNAAVDKLKGLLASIVEGPLGQMAETIANMIAGIAKIPGVKEILGYAAPIAAVLTGGMLVRSLTKGTSMNPMVVTMAGGGGGVLGGGGAGGSRPTGLGRVARAFSRGGVGGGGRAMGRMLKSTVKGVGGKLGILGALGSLGMDIAEGGINMESIGRAGLSGLGSIAGGALGSLIAPGIGTIGGGVAGGMAGDFLANKIFGERVEMATGGIVTKPTNALVGEAGPEAVIPLSKLMNEFVEMKKYLAQIATKEGNIYMGPTKVGTAVTVGTYKTQ
jgi:hypothetical protein